MIRKQAYNKLGISKYKPCNKMIVSYTQDEIRTVGQVKLGVKICKKIQVTHDFIIVPDEYMETDILLGADLIGRAPFSWNGEINEIQWGTAKFKVNKGHKCRIWGINVTKQTEVIDVGQRLSQDDFISTYGTSERLYHT